uniref:serine/threonine receptor-like kinase NFP n=1 Tax=Styela clava TaxID=7725 RepID=UPI00193AA974|nr:serine/threonine receptor-like kinase NFP [Styela clava]
MLELHVNKFSMLSSRNIVLLFLLIVRLSMLHCMEDPCHSDIDERLNITFNTSTTFNLANVSDIGKYNIHVTFSWNVEGDEDYDGFLYKFEDRDDVLNGVQKRKSSTKMRFRPFGSRGFSRIIPACKKATGKEIWISTNGTENQCEMPCLEYITNECRSDELCNLLNSGYISVPKSVRNVTLTGKFGRVYDLKMKAYRGKTIGKYFDVENHDLPSSDPIYCNNKLIEEIGIEKDIAFEFCKKEQKIADLVSSSGPPADFEEVRISRNLETNRGEIVFRWHSPYDISHRTTLNAFDVSVTDGILKQTRVIALQNNTEHYYEDIVSNIKFGKKGVITVTPIFTSNCKENGSLFECVNHGVSRLHTFFVEDIDACANRNEEIRYCDSIASCYDLAPENTTAAICSCPAGYDGNGVNNSFESGTGCFDHDSCSADDHNCVSEAICKDLPPPDYSAICTCPSTHIGDGQINGTGCTSLSLVLGLGVGLPLAILTVLLLWLAAWRLKVTKKREIELKLSKFIVTKETNNIMKNGNANGHAQKTATLGIFGEKWEIDRNNLEFKEVIGRGNFGVVHKALLKTPAEEKVVAVKSIPETYDESGKNAFLAEIALISNIGTHRNIMGIIGCCTIGDSPLCFVTDLMKYGDLLHFLWNAREESKRSQDPAYCLTELDIHKIGKEVAEGMQYLTNLKIIHGDVAARNILIGENLLCKISDFGLANDVYRYGAIKEAWEKRVPIKWVSPERMMDGKVPITWRSDVWSYGVLLYEIVTLGASPYPAIPQEEIFQFLERGDRMARPLTCSETLYGIMLKCWKWTPSSRPTFKQLVKDMDIAMTSGDEFREISEMVTSLDVEAYQSEIAFRNGVASA